MHNYSHKFCNFCILFCWLRAFDESFCIPPSRLVLMAWQNFVILLIFASYVIKLKQNDCFADWIQFRNTFPLSSFLLVTACVLTFFKAINCSTWSSSWTSLLLDKTKKTVIIVFIIHYRKFVWHMDDCSVICMSWVNLRDRVGKERWWQTLCDKCDNYFVWNNLPLNFTLL